MTAGTQCVGSTCTGLPLVFPNIKTSAFHANDWYRIPYPSYRTYGIIEPHTWSVQVPEVHAWGQMGLLLPFINGLRPPGLQVECSRAHAASSHC